MIMKKVCFVLWLIVSFSLAKADSIKSTAKGGIWNEPGTWEGGVVPAQTDEVTIATGAKVTVTQHTKCGKLQINGILDFSAGSLGVNGDLVINAGGQFRAWAGGSVSILINGNLINNGMADLSRNGAVFRMGAPAVSAPTAIEGGGTYAKNVVRTLRIDNPAGVTLKIPLSISAGLSLWSGKFTTGNNLTLDNTAPGNGRATAVVVLERKEGALADNYKLGTNATLKEQ